MNQKRTQQKQLRPTATVGSRVLKGINVAVAAICIVCAYSGYIDPRITLIPAMAVMVYPVMAAACVLMVIADLIMAYRLAIWPAAALVLTAGSLYNLCPLNIGCNTSPCTSPNEGFTLMTYNVYGFVNHDPEHTDSAALPTLATIARVRPDVVCLQEALPLNAIRSRDPLLVDSVTALYPHRIFSGGLMVMSRDSLVLVPTGVDNSDSFDLMCVRALIGGHSIFIVDVHLQSIGLTTDDKQIFRELTDMEANRQVIREARTEVFGKLAAAFRQRAIQSRIVRQFVDSLPGDVVLCGDFNDVPLCNAVHIIRGSDLSDAYADGALGPTITYNSNRFYFRIDHILYRGDMDAAGTRRFGDRGSDHYALMTKFLWK